ncbi:cytochrome b561 and DOMON domain-containing protein At3g61750-like [Silene latifolia]|uniref:cytochrome b561 and DOMON domain-containing protein At3g61750-like n=1 Tax=Silene latifolia TaxID=37657 RepID=UPI003D76A753
MGALAIQRWGCIFAILCLIFEPEINVNGADEKELEKSLPSEFKDALGPGAVVLNNIWNANSIRYARNSENETTIIYSGPYTKGWMGIGLSKTGGMIGSSAMIGWTGEGGGKNMIKQYSLQGYVPAKVIANKGELQLTKVAPTSIIIKGTLYMAFQLKFPSNNMKQKVIFAVSPDSPIGDILAVHKDITMKEIDFSKGDVDSSASIRKAAHGAIAFTGWIVLIPVGILFPVYFKQYDPLWFHVHKLVQITGYILAFITVLLGLRVSADLHIDWGFHKFIGITVLFLGTLQVLAIWARPAKDSPSRLYWNKYHHGVGYTATILALLNFLMGVKLGNAGIVLKIVFVVWFIGLNIFVFFVVPRIARRTQVVTDQPPVFTPGSS